MSRKPYGLTVRAIILDGHGRCLLMQRSKKCRTFPGQWEWPGGKVDQGEALDVGLLREVREETGLEIELGKVTGASSRELESIVAVVICLEATIIGGEFRISDEHDDHAWVPILEILDWDMSEPLKKLAASFTDSQRIAL